MSVTSMDRMKRIGHIAVSVFNDQLVLVWGGYMEPNVSTESDHLSRYYDPQEVLLFNPISTLVCSRTTTGHVPPSNSGTCAVIGGEKRELLYVYGGYFADPDLEGNSNQIYELNLNTWIWTRLNPAGHQPLHRDKLIGWEWRNKIYFFSGFGTPPIEDDFHADLYEYIMDRSHQHLWYIGRGWNNQLVAYCKDKNVWEWPETKGQTPTPRAALAGFRCNSRVYIFGGRLKETRMNDLYYLDLNSMTWSDNLNLGKSAPCGRSWHSFTLIDSRRALLYGGLSSEGEVLGDRWMYHIDDNTWKEFPIAKLDKRLWHQAVFIDDEVVVIGGTATNVHSTNNEPTVHADGLLLLPVVPKSLLRLCLELCRKHFNPADTFCLPQHLLDLMEMRHSKL